MLFVENCEMISVSRMKIETRFVTDCELRELPKILKITPQWLLGIEWYINH